MIVMEAMLFVAFLIVLMFSAPWIAAYYENTSVNHDPKGPVS